MSEAPRRILVVEDDARYRSSLELFFKYAPGFVLAQALSTGEEAVRWAESLAARGEPCAWDLALLDLQLPNTSGADLTRVLKQAFPEVPVVILTVFEEPASILQCICAGADGYLLKKTPANALREALKGACDGGAPLTPGVARAVIDMLRRSSPLGAASASLPGFQLTEREHDVLRCLVKGLSYKQAADVLGVSVDTVRSHIRQLYRKLNVHSMSAAVSRALREGLV